jgi:hypothetical protein
MEAIAEGRGMLKSWVTRVVCRPLQAIQVTNPSQKPVHGSQTL